MNHEISLLAVLSILTCQDYRKRSVNLYLILAAAVLGVTFQVLTGAYSISELLAGIGIGVIVCSISVIAKGKVGMGDGAVLIVSGLFLGFERNLMLCIYAVYLAGAAALILLLIRKRGKNYRMPFVPFILAAYVLILL